SRSGLEMGTQLEILKDFNFTFSYTWSNFTYDTYLAKTIEIDSTGNYVENERDFSGNIVPSVPRNNLYLGLSYARPILRNIQGFIKLSQMSISGLWVDDANTEQTNAYTLLNSVLGLDIKFGNLNLLLSGGVNNILDEVYVGFTNTNSADKRFYEAGAPRNYYVALNIGYTF
ncbi:MAG: hypothetical protein K8S16_11350, partial [Bacteroidales bacterium]|nr:hypothetical protein [Bacteroidales bacterium]